MADLFEGRRLPVSADEVALARATAELLAYERARDRGLAPVRSLPPERRVAPASPGLQEPGYMRWSHGLRMVPYVALGAGLVAPVILELAARALDAGAEMMPPFLPGIPAWWPRVDPSWGVFSCALAITVLWIVLAAPRGDLLRAAWWAAPRLSGALRSAARAVAGRARALREPKVVRVGRVRIQWLHATSR